MKLSIIIPVFNEEKTIEETLRRVAQAETPGFDKEIIVVDDGSKDSSKLKAQSSKPQLKAQNLKIIEHKENQGKGCAVKTGLKQATGDLILIQDADLEYDPNDYKKLLGAYGEKTPVVFGSRNVSAERKGYFYCFWGVKFLTFLFNSLFKTELTDLYTCYKLFPASLMRDEKIESQGFEFEAEITAKLIKSGVKIKEVPINYFPRTFKQGKKIRFRDGLVGLWTILKNRV